MANRKNNDLIGTLTTERYLIWAIVVAVSVAISLLGTISVSNQQTDYDISTSENIISNLK